MRAPVAMPSIPAEVEHFLEDIRAGRVPAADVADGLVLSQLRAARDRLAALGRTRRGRAALATELDAICRTIRMVDEEAGDGR